MFVASKSHKERLLVYIDEYKINEVVEAFIRQVEYKKCEEKKNVGDVITSSNENLPN